MQLPSAERKKGVNNNRSTVNVLAKRSRGSIEAGDKTINGLQDAAPDHQKHVEGSSQ